MRSYKKKRKGKEKVWRSNWQLGNDKNLCSTQSTLVENCKLVPCSSSECNSLFYRTAIKSSFWWWSCLWRRLIALSSSSWSWSWLWRLPNSRRFQIFQHQCNPGPASQVHIYNINVTQLEEAPQREDTPYQIGRFFGVSPKRGGGGVSTYFNFGAGRFFRSMKVGASDHFQD